MCGMSDASITAAQIVCAAVRAAMMVTVQVYCDSRYVWLGQLCAGAQHSAAQQRSTVGTGVAAQQALEPSTAQRSTAACSATDAGCVCS